MFRFVNCMNISMFGFKKKFFIDVKMNSLVFNLKDYGFENFWVIYSCILLNKFDC